MKHIYFDAAQKKVTGWVKNARNFAEEHPILMATGGLVGGALYACLLYTSDAADD